MCVTPPRLFRPPHKLYGQDLVIVIQIIYVLTAHRRAFNGLCRLAVVYAYAIYTAAWCVGVFHGSYMLKR